MCGEFAALACGLDFDCHTHGRPVEENPAESPCPSNPMGNLILTVALLICISAAKGMVSITAEQISH